MVKAMQCKSSATQRKAKAVIQCHHRVRNTWAVMDEGPIHGLYFTWILMKLLLSIIWGLS